MPLIEKRTPVITVEDTFKRQMVELEKRCGPETKLRTYEVLSEVVKWLYERGDGNITLSAENHLLRQEIRAETTITAKGQ